MDFELNYKKLTPEQHRGNDGPHMCRETDLRYKQELQDKLEQRLDKDYYQTDELVRLLGLKRKQATKAFRWLNHGKGITREDVIRRLMGNRLY